MVPLPARPGRRAGGQPGRPGEGRHRIRLQRALLLGHRDLRPAVPHVHDPALGAERPPDAVSHAARGPEARPPKFNEIDFAVAFARLESHYFVNGGFFPEDDWILKNIGKIGDIPGWIVQGRFDVVTPLEAAWRLNKAWPASRFEIIWDAGHASTEPGVIDALVRATDQALRV